MLEKDSGMVIVLSGFSGAGKGTIMKHLMSRHPDTYHLSISATTRGIRDGEEDGREYFFKSKESFEQMIAAGELLEYANFNGNYYGTPRAYVQEEIAAGRDIILEIEVQGALQVKKIFPEALLLFVTPPSAEALKDRLLGRGTESEEVVAQRLAISARESRLMNEYDYLVINDKIEDSVAQVHSIIQSEHNHTSRRREAIARIQRELQAFAKGEE